VARLRARIERAAALHRQVAALAAAAAPVLDAYAPAGAPVDQYADQHDLAASLRADASALAPGWLSAPLDALAPSTPLGGPLPPTFVRVGQAHPLDDARFPVVVPLLRAGHIAIDADARDNRVAALLRSLVLRLLASSPPGSVRIRTVDAAGVGSTFGGFTGIDTIMPPAAASAEDLRAVLDEAERWIAGRADDGAGPTLLIIIASLPELTEGRDLARIAALAHAGPAGRLHLIAAGWPPPPLTAETTQAPLPHATQIALRNPYVWVGDPPGATFGANGVGPSRLNAPVYLDPDPPAELIRAVCAQLAAPWTAPPMLPGEPSRKSWLDYLAAGQRLDAVRRDAAAVVAEHKTALAAAREDLKGLLKRLNRHQARLTETARNAGGRPIELVPTWDDTQSAQATLTAMATPARVGPPPRHASPLPGVGPPSLHVGPNRHTGQIPAVSAPPAHHPRHARVASVSGPPTTGWQAPIPTSVPPRPGSNSGAWPTVPVSGGPTNPVSPPTSPAPTSLPGRVSAALRMAAVSLDGSEAALAGDDDSPRVGLNLAVYGAFALLAALIQIPMLLVMDNGGRGAVLAIPCAVVLPILSFGLAWVTIGALAPKKSPRTPLLGGVISLLALVPLVVILIGNALTLLTN
jgi:hypothetical protein